MNLKRTGIGIASIMVFAGIGALCSEFTEIPFLNNYPMLWIIIGIGVGIVLSKRFEQKEEEAGE